MGLLDRMREVHAAVHTLNADQVTTKDGERFAPGTLKLEYFTWQRVFDSGGNSSIKWSPAKCSIVPPDYSFADVMYQLAKWPDWLELEVR